MTTTALWKQATETWEQLYELAKGRADYWQQRAKELQAFVKDLEADRDYWKSRTLQPELWDGPKRKDT